MLKSVGIVIGSYVVTIILVLCSDPLLSLFFPEDFIRGRMPSNAALLASTADFIAISILGAWLCARFAPRRPSLHVFWFFVLGEGMGIATTVPNWKSGWPHWYFLSWLLSWPLSCWLGYVLAQRRPVSSSVEAS